METEKKLKELLMQLVELGDIVEGITQDVSSVIIQLEAEKTTAK